MMRKNIKLIVILFSIFIFKMLFLVPVNITGGLANINDLRYISIFEILNGKYECDSFIDGFCYDVLLVRHIIELILILTIILFVFFLKYRSFKRGDNNK